MTSRGNTGGGGDSAAVEVVATWLAGGSGHVPRSYFEDAEELLAELLPVLSTALFTHMDELGVDAKNRPVVVAAWQRVASPSPGAQGPGGEG